MVNIQIYALQMMILILPLSLYYTALAFEISIAGSFPCSSIVVSSWAHAVALLTWRGENSNTNTVTILQYQPRSESSHTVQLN